MHDIFCILLGHICFSFKTTVVFQLFPCEGISFPWTKAQYFLSAACTPLQHLSFPRRPRLSVCSRKGLPCRLGKKQVFDPQHNLSSTKRRPGKHSRQHQYGGPPVCTLPSTEAEQRAPQSNQHPPTLSGTRGCHCGAGMCMPGCVHGFLCRIESAGQNPALTNSQVSLEMLLKVMGM